MQFVRENDLVFVKCVELISSKTGKPFHLVTVADPATYENVEMFPSKAEDWQTIKPGTKVKAYVEISSRSTSLVRVMG